MDLMKFAEWFSKGESLVNRLSLQEGARYFRWGLFISSVMFFLKYPGKWPLSDGLQNFLAYLLAAVVALVLSYIVWDGYLKEFFRNLVSIIIFSVWFPNRVHLIVIAILTGNLRVEGFLLFGVSALSMIIFWMGRKDWRFHAAIIEQSGFYTWMKLPLYHLLQNSKLQKKQNCWGNWKELNIKDLRSARWWKLSKTERSDLIQKVAQYEAEELALDSSFSLFVYSSWDGIAADTQCDIDVARKCIIWDEDTVELFLPQHILEEMIASMQLYKWYETLSVEEQDALDKGQVFADTLLIKQLKSAKAGEAYNLLSRLYAKTRSDWYCGF